MYEKKPDPYAHVTCAVELITPEQAEEILKRSEGRNFRRLRDRSAEFIAVEIREGRFLLNGESIILDREGRCIDGQHRLLGCVLAGKPIYSVVVRGIDHDLYMDSGENRTAAQVLTKDGFLYATLVAAIAKYAITYERGVRSVLVANGKIDRGQIVAYARAHPELQDSCRVAEAARKLMMTSVPAWVHYEASRRGMRDVVEAFINAVATGEGLERTNPAFCLRARMLGNTGLSRISKFHVMALTMKAWNAWAGGDRIVTLKVYSGRETQVLLPEFYEEK